MPMLTSDLRPSNLRPIPDVQYNVAFTLSASRIVRLALPQEANGEKKKRERKRVPGRRDAAPRLASKEVISARCHYSSRPVQPLFLDRESISGVRRPRTLSFRAPALITRHRGYYRGNAKRPSFPAARTLSPSRGRERGGSSSTSPPSCAILRAFRTVMRVALLSRETLFFLHVAPPHHVLHHVNDHRHSGVAYIAESCEKRDAFNKSFLEKCKDNKITINHSFKRIGSLWLGSRFINVTARDSEFYLYYFFEVNRSIITCVSNKLIIKITFCSIRLRI